MKVVATAGHVDHGKSALVRALTGMEPDRWAEERRRGMTIDLGFAWTEVDCPGGIEVIAFVDVPGHQKFVTNMLAGVGPVPAVLFVVAADAGWSRQSSEHLDAIQALGITAAAIAVTKTDLVEPARTARVSSDATERLTAAGLRVVDAVGVSAVSGAGLPALRTALGYLVRALPEPRVSGKVRLWVDRTFTVRGAGTVVTGTLGAGRLDVGDELELRSRRYRVRGIEQLGTSRSTALATSRVAVNLRGLDRAEVQRGDCLITPNAWHRSRELDVLLDPAFADAAGQQMLHIGSASIPVAVRMLGDRAARLVLDRPIPVETGDRGVLRDPGQQSVLAGVRVLDPDPPGFRRRGDAARRAGELESGLALTASAQLRRRGAVRVGQLERLGFTLPEQADAVSRGDWLIDPRTWQGWREALLAGIEAQIRADPRRPGLPLIEALRLTGAPDPELLRLLAQDVGLVVSNGRLTRAGVAESLGAAESAVEGLIERLAGNPFDAPERNELAALQVDHRDLATAAQAGRLLRLAPELVVGAAAPVRAVELLAALEQPFSVSDARQRLGTTRRVAVPLLEYLDKQRLTTVDPDGRRRLVRPAGR